MDGHTPCNLYRAVKFYLKQMDLFLIIWTASYSLEQGTNVQLCHNINMKHLITFKVHMLIMIITKECYRIVINNGLYN